jgi:hypothetical protein
MSRELPFCIMTPKRHRHPALARSVSMHLKLALILLLLSGLLVTGAADDDEHIDDDEQDISDSDEDEEDEWDRDFIESHYVEIDKDHDCRDDAYLNCTEQQEKGECEDEEDLLGTRALCPITCNTGTCTLPNRTSVWVEFKCFQHGEDIQVFFTNSDPQPDDFIAIYPEYLNFTENPEDLEESYMWFYCCGSMHENCRVAMGGLEFGGAGPDEHSEWTLFPLESGKYKAVLLRGDESTILAQSQVFTAKPEGHSCYSECRDLIYTDQLCYTPKDDTIDVTFENCVPREDDRVAIYSDKETNPGRNEPLLWLGTCGNQTCNGKVATESLSFGVGEPKEDSSAQWPLPPGDYKAYLMRTNEGGRYGRASGESSSFTIKFEGESCYDDSEDL